MKNTMVAVEKAVVVGITREEDGDKDRTQANLAHPKATTNIGESSVMVAKGSDI